MEKIICPICKSERNNFFCKKDVYDIYNCQDCEAGFVWPIPSDLKKIYGEDYFKDGGREKSFGYTDYDKDKEPMEETFISYLKKIERLTKGRNIFDLGAATGHFLNLARNRGWHTSGVEISKYAADIANGRGHKVFIGRLVDIEIDDKFDVVTMWDVLEHLDNPMAYLYKINKLLNKNGLLAINTINNGSLWARFWGSRWQAIVPPEHLFYFSVKSLTKLIEDSGFKIIEIKKVGKNFSLAYIFKTLYNWQNLKIWARLSVFFDKEYFRKFYIPINLRDNIFIIARKEGEIIKEYADLSVI